MEAFTASMVRSSLDRQRLHFAACALVSRPSRIPELRRSEHFGELHDPFL